MVEEFDPPKKAGEPQPNTSDELIASDQLGLSELAPVDLYQKREKIYTRKIEGFFQRLRTLTGWPLLLGYFLLPWFSLEGRQAILFDLPERKFHIFWMTFWPQDFPLLAWLLIIAAFALFAITNFAGRVWCGYTCPQTVWTAIYMWMEQVTEGNRNQRIKLDKASISGEKLLRKSIKHLMWGGFAFLTGFTFIGYFVPVQQLLPNFFSGQAYIAAYAWILFFTLATYINAAYMREQVCKYMCPYARFQSAMFDRDTLIVSYDEARGEPRGSRRRDADYKAQGKGDCIDCELCVQVCPTGIDIRNGLQYECITCALCIDACNSVMDKMDYPRGLIRYTTAKNLAGGKTSLFRPKMIGYSLMMLIMCSLFVYTLGTRIPLRVDIIRDRGDLFELQDGLVTNVYEVRVLNLSDEPQTYQLQATGLEGLRILGNQFLNVEGGEALTLPVRLVVPQSDILSPIEEISIRVTSEGQPGLVVEEESRFIAPTN